MDDPRGVECFSGTGAYGILGTNIVGYYTDKATNYQGFLLNGANWTNWTTLDAPLGVGNTYAEGVSDNNIVGLYWDNRGHEHGFLATLIPKLTMTHSGNSLKISWPYYPLVSWTLQQNLNLSTTNWAPTPTGSISNDGTNNFITLTSPTGNLFFRLTNP